ncbi:MAG: endolytic transglycosylase MltG [Clostridium sp.]|uniref:endolytic transglycosylase MltG n=1 Tax=Clostridium sp. TaxID=1506 RepID=UPI002FC928A2
MRKKRNFWVIVVVLLIIVVGGTIFMYNKTVNHPIKSNEETITINVKEGEGFYSLLNDLKSQNLIKNEFFIKMYLKLNKITPNVTEGTYKVSSDTDLQNLINTLESVNTTKVVIPEGYTVSQIGDVLEKSGLFSKEEFIKATKNYKLPSYIKTNKEVRDPLEGFLFPDTYAFKEGITPDEVIKTMLTQFETVLKEVEKETGVQIPEDKIYETVTKASVIEKEARVDEDRPIISSVIDNRLQKGMNLQIDATVIYALGKHVDVVSLNDLKVDSPYNTYKHKGLPVGPICNPGKPSLIAALKPAKTDYLFYLLVPGTNKHDFTNSGNEFNKLREKYGYNK